MSSSYERLTPWENKWLDPVHPCADSIFCKVEKAGK